MKAGSVHPAVAKLNWLSFLESDDFDTQVDALIAAMDLDFDWLRGHTRLLVRAEEWQRRDADGSLLLRGADLRDTERWLLAGDTKAKRVPTPLQTQFIVASRQAETRRRNVQRAIALVVLSALSIYSWIQKNIAERQRNLAISRQLAARAANLGTENNLTRLLVSALATRYSHSSEADASLAQSLLPTVPLTKVLWSHFRGDWMDCISFHRDGAYIAGSNTHGVTIWRVVTGRVEAFLPNEDGVDCVTFGPRDDPVAISDEGRAIVWDWKQNHRRTFGPEPNLTPTRGWPRWMDDQLDSPEFVLVCTGNLPAALSRAVKSRIKEKGRTVREVSSHWSCTMPEVRRTNSYRCFLSLWTRLFPGNSQATPIICLVQKTTTPKLYDFLTGQAGGVPGTLGPFKTRAREAVEPLRFDVSDMPARQLPLSNLPERNLFFSGRKDVLAELQKALAAQGQAALSGLGGVGKTQTAVEYAHRHLDEYIYTFWVTAHSQEALVSSYVMASLWPLTKPVPT